MVRKKLLIVTGELSGDMHGYDLAKSLISNKENIEIFAVGGKNLSSLPINIIGNISDYSTVGIIEFIPFLRKLLRARKKIIEVIKKNKFDMVVFIDNQGFNIPLARKCKKYGIKCVYYFPPIVSVWDRKNAKVLPKIFDLIICPFKMDYEIYKNNSGNAFFSGHPFLDTLKPEKEKETVMSELNIPETNKIVALCPGSRKKEVKTLLPKMLKGVEKIIVTNKNISIILPIADKNLENLVYNTLQDFKNFPINIVDGADKSYIAASDLIIGASGSLAIEAAILKKPMIVCYKISKISYFVAKLLLMVKFISWPNILLNKMFYPELLQRAVNEKNIYNYSIALINCPKEVFENDFIKVINALGSFGVIERVKNIILKELKNE